MRAAERLEERHDLGCARGACHRAQRRPEPTPRARCRRGSSPRPGRGDAPSGRPATRDLVLVTGADAALGRADGARSLLAQSVDDQVVRQDGVGAVRDGEARPAEVGREVPPADELIDLADEAPRVDDHPLRRGRRSGPCPENAARDEPDNDLVGADHERVTRVGTSAEPHDHFGLLGEDVDDLPLPFVAPLGSDDHHGGHALSLHELALAGSLVRQTAPCHGRWQV